MAFLPKACAILLLCGVACSGPDTTDKDVGREPLLLSVADDVALGQQVAAQINSNPQEFPILDPEQHPQAYAYLRQLVANIVQRGRVKHAEAFAWDVWIVNRPDVQNAFCVPGGHIYVYTGLIQTLDHDYELAGVLGHEIAHADLRHTSRSLEKAYGMQLLINLLLGQDQSLATDIGQQLAQLSFSRKYEREADAMSVNYLCNTQYEAYGAAVFFEKMLEGGTQAPPEFLSTHPDPGGRSQYIRQRAEAQRCDAPDAPDRYAQFKASLPR